MAFVIFVIKLKKAGYGDYMCSWDGNQATWKCSRADALRFVTKQEAQDVADLWKNVARYPVVLEVK